MNFYLLILYHCLSATQTGEVSEKTNCLKEWPQQIRNGNKLPFIVPLNHFFSTFFFQKGFARANFRNYSKFWKFSANELMNFKSSDFNSHCQKSEKKNFLKKIKKFFFYLFFLAFLDFFRNLKMLFIPSFFCYQAVNNFQVPPSAESSRSEMLSRCSPGDGMTNLLSSHDLNNNVLWK